MSLALLRPRVIGNVRDTSAILANPADYDTALRAAVDRYSKARPLELVADLVGTGSYDLVLPDAWQASWSEPRQVEYPVGERKPQLVPPSERAIYTTPDGPVLRLLCSTPGAGELVRLTYTVLHSIEENATTVPVADHNAVVLIASALACEQIASRYANKGSSTLKLDGVDQKSQSAEFAGRARQFMRLGEELLPVQPIGEVKAAGRGGSIPLANTSLSHDRFF